MPVNFSQTAYNRGGNLIQFAPTPIVANRNPTNADFAEIGSMWINESSVANANAFVLSGIFGGQANWLDISSSGSGAGVFSSLLVTPGFSHLLANSNTANAIQLQTNGGTTETITITNSQGTSAGSIAIASTAGGITSTSALQNLMASSQANAAAIRLNASNSAGGIDVDCGTGGLALDSTGIVAITSTDNTAGAVSITSNGGTSDSVIITSQQGTGTASIALNSVAGGIQMTSALATSMSSAAAAGEAIVIAATNSAGGIDIDAGTGGINIESSGIIALTSTDNAAGAIALSTNAGTTETMTLTVSQGTAAGSLALESTAGGITSTAALQNLIASSQAAASAIRLNASNSAGGIDVDCGTGGIDIATTSTATTGINLVANTAAGSGITATVGATGGFNVAGGPLVAAAALEGLTVYATGDNGGIASTNSFTNATNTTQGAGTLSIKSTDGNSGNNAGFIKVYIGTTVAYVPYFTNIAP